MLKIGIKKQTLYSQRLCGQEKRSYYTENVKYNED